MRILALDASGKACSVAVRDKRLIGEEYINNGLTHSETLMPSVDALMCRLDMPMDSLDAVAVTIGPGSFTGLRIGLACAKGIADGLGIPIAPVSTLETIAFPAQVSGRLVCPIMDARRDEVYTAVYRSGETLIEPCAVHIDVLFDRLEEYGDDVLFCGDGTQPFAERIRAAFAKSGIMADSLVLQRASWAAEIAENNNIFLPSAAVELSYLRESNAQTMEQRMANARGSI